MTTTFHGPVAEFYESIFKPNRAQLSFLSSSCAGKRILDVACGTGAVAGKLAEEGYELTAVDYSEKMIEGAKEKTQINAFVADMRDLSGVGKDYDLVYCIGNSIALLDSADEIRLFFEEAYKACKFGGRLVLQWVNFYPFWSRDGENLGSLPTIENPEIRFERHYYRKDNKILFKTVLHHGQEKIENSADLYPIMHDEAIGMLEGLGFGDIELFGAFDKSAFKKDSSFHVVVRAKKI